MIRVTIWNEFKHEREYEAVRENYPEGIHGCIAAFPGEEQENCIRRSAAKIQEIASISQSS